MHAVQLHSVTTEIRDKLLYENVCRDFCSYSIQLHMMVKYDPL